jgi:hypothetical protein
MAHAGGAPSKYDPKFNYEVYKYLATTGREQTKLPTIEGFAIHIGVNPDTIFEWKKKYPKFSESIKAILARQKEQLINDGAYGGREVNVSMMIFLLKSNHNMIETEKKIIAGDTDNKLEIVITEEDPNRKRYD